MKTVKAILAIAIISVMLFACDKPKDDVKPWAVGYWEGKGQNNTDGSSFSCALLARPDGTGIFYFLRRLDGVGDTIDTTHAATRRFDISYTVSGTTFRATILTDALLMHTMEIIGNTIDYTSIRADWDLYERSIPIQEGTLFLKKVE